MASKSQRRLWRYVKSGCRYKLRKLLQRHRDMVDLTETVGRKKRTPLHQSCAQQDLKTAILLLKYGADPNIQDRYGDTALHLAARQVARKGSTVYENLFIPLRTRCPSAASVRNNKGKTPGDLLRRTGEKWCPQERFEEHEEEPDSEKEWRRKLLGEWEDEYQEPFQQFEEDFGSIGPEPESFETWADRIFQEYRKKQRKEEERHHQRPKAQPTKPSLKEEERQLYEKRAKAKEEELKEAKRQRYEESCSRVFLNDGSQALRYVDIPWPCPTGTPDEMAAVALHRTDRSDRAAYRAFLRRQQVLWHPDKFVQRCGARLAEQDRRRILDTVTALSQAFNQLAEAAK